ncbi:MAG TPA: TetR/AcrR family transcriptional regulator [Rhizomicrobium sp.]|jgi:AcrR family transcriptional regulator
MATGRPTALQDRSAVTEDRLCDAAEALLREGGLAACTVDAVAERATRSPASVYRRFGDKDRMIEAVFERYVARARAANEANLRAVRRHSRNLSGRLKAIVDGAVAGYRRDGQLTQAFREAAARSSTHSFEAAARRVREATLGLASQALCDCVADPDKARAVDFALAVLAGSLETLLRAPQPFGDRVLRNELHAMLLAYLTDGDED